MRLQRTCSSSQSLDLSLKTVLEDRLSENISNVKFTQCILDRWRRHQASTPYYESSFRFPSIPYNHANRMGRGLYTYNKLRSVRPSPLFSLCVCRPLLLVAMVKVYGGFVGRCHRTRRCRRISRFYPKAYEFMWLLSADKVVKDAVHVPVETTTAEQGLCSGKNTLSPIPESPEDTHSDSSTAASSSSDATVVETVRCESGDVIESALYPKSSKLLSSAQPSTISTSSNCRKSLPNPKSQSDSISKENTSVPHLPTNHTTESKRKSKTEHRKKRKRDPFDSDAHSDSDSDSNSDSDDDDPFVDKPRQYLPYSVQRFAKELRKGHIKARGSHYLGYSEYSDSEDEDSSYPILKFKRSTESVAKLTAQKKALDDNVISYSVTASKDDQHSENVHHEEEGSLIPSDNNDENDSISSTKSQTPNSKLTAYVVEQGYDIKDSKTSPTVHLIMSRRTRALRKVQWAKEKAANAAAVAAAIAEKVTTSADDVDMESTDEEISGEEDSNSNALVIQPRPSSFTFIRDVDLNGSAPGSLCSIVSLHSRSIICPSFASPVPLDVIHIFAESRSSFFPMNPNSSSCGPLTIAESRHHNQRLTFEQFAAILSSITNNDNSSKYDMKQKDPSSSSSVSQPRDILVIVESSDRLSSQSPLRRSRTSSFLPLILRTQDNVIQSASILTSHLSALLPHRASKALTLPTSPLSPILHRIPRVNTMLPFMTLDGLSPILRSLFSSFCSRNKRRYKPYPSHSPRRLKGHASPFTRLDAIP
ncbi:hypothetical protein C8Q75DRAFT_581283 [Abortiporus biennis]|nr:hypothetical protein C8Q75DRAFT_581283 [Abortiporus biennis]